MLYRQSDGQVGIMTAFEKVGPVDVARVMYPLRANDNYGLLLVNGDPAILDVDDLKQLDQAAMDQNPMYRAVKQKYTATTLFPGDRSGSMWPQVKPLPDGGQQFILGYPLMNGCHACANVGLALFSWDFDAKGKFVGTKYIATPPPPKLMRPNRVPQPPPHGTTPTATAVSHQRMEGFCGRRLGESCQTAEARCAAGAGFTELPSSGYTPFIRPADNKREPMRKPLLFLVILIFVSHCGGQSKPGAIDAAEVWEPPQTFVATVSKACGNPSQDRKYADCFMAQMSKAGRARRGGEFHSRVLQGEPQRHRYHDQLQPRWPCGHRLGGLSTPSSEQLRLVSGQRRPEVRQRRGLEAA